MMSVRTSIAAAAIALALSPRPTFALDPNLRITQYRHTAWRVQEGAFGGAPNAIAQTSDGYIWIGTDSGLVRYDGVRFVPWSGPAGGGSVGAPVYSLLGSSDGALWIGTATRLLRWKNNTLNEYRLGRINSILEDRRHRIWVARSRVADSRGGLCQATGDEPRCIGGEHGMGLPYAQTLSEDTRGNLWVGSSSQLMKWHDGSFESYFRKELAPFQALNSVSGVAAGADGSVWAAIPRKGLGLFHIVDGLAGKVKPEGADSERIESPFVDRDGSLWMGTPRDGIYRMYGGRVDRFRGEDGLSSNAVTAFFQDREGNLWVATSKGLDCFRESRVVTFSASEGLGADLAESVVASADGGVWIGNRGSLDLLRAGKVTSIRIPGQRVTSLWQDRDNDQRLWVGVDNFLTVYERGRFHRVDRPDGSPLGTTVAIAGDRDRNVWVSVVGAERRLFRIRDLRVQEAIAPDQVPSPRLIAADPTGGLWLGFGYGKGNFGHYRAGKLETLLPTSSERSVFGLNVDADGSAWVSASDGIHHSKNGEVKTLTSRNGLPCDAMLASIRDNRAALWIYSKCGLIAIADSELERWWRQPDTTVRFELFDPVDGALPGLSTFQPAVAKSSDGSLWFVNDTVLQTIDPGMVRKNETPPPVYVEEVLADRKDYPVGGLLRFRPHSRDIEIGYTALSFSAPQRVRFRYKLDGRDRDWQDAGDRRQAFYNDLPPGAYRFHVAASNGDGVWNGAGASLDFSVYPAFYQTLWFQAACVGVFLAALGGLYRYRLRGIAHEFNVRLEERVAERTRIARDLHDTLLQSFQGLMLRLQVVDDLLPEGKAKRQLEESLQRADRAIAEGRNAVYDLRSSATQTNDMAQAVTALAEELSTEDSPEFRLVVEGSARDLRPVVRDELYRIAREALRNAFAHARARRIETEIAWGEQAFRLRIRDDGDGIPPEILEEGRPGHYGLPGIRERAGQIGGALNIWSRAKAGTEIEVTVAGSIAYAAPAGRPLLGLFRNNAGGA
jgi:ligand-binding sensor domain-containing protein/two-component sensor histidine kinase